MEIRSCPKCGNTNLRQSTYTDGDWITQAFGEPVKYICDKCLYRGMPILFSSIEDYKNFLKEIKK
jgi:hypothetical protein